jgi:hypothetical protein
VSACCYRMSLSPAFVWLCDSCCRCSTASAYGSSECNEIVCDDTEDALILAVTVAEEGSAVISVNMN